jgi:hypothetical protein
MTTQKSFSALETQVMYQKLNGVWYAFCEIDNDILFAQLPHGWTPGEPVDFYQLLDEEDRKKLVAPRRFEQAA